MGKNDIFNFKAGGVWSLVREGYQVYYGEQYFVFVNAEKNCQFMILRNTSDEDMGIKKLNSMANQYYV